MGWKSSDHGLRRFRNVCFGNQGLLLSNSTIPDGLPVAAGPTPTVWGDGSGLSVSG